MKKQQAPMLKRDDIMSVLSSADELALENGDDLFSIHADWLTDLEFLFSDDCPVTYLPVLTVMLVARSMRSKDELDVLDIQRGTSIRGYSAPSIASHLINFVGQIGVDLRTTSSQVMNSQPFTYKHRVLSDMAGARYRIAYSRFFEMALRVEDLNSEAAVSLLALIFHCRRGAGVSNREEIAVTGNRETLELITERVAAFVNDNSEAGKVGQAFAATLFDLLFPSEQVRMGNNNDPSSMIPGDVQVSSDGSYWLWAEVKQRAVVTSEIQSFIDRVKAIGGDRVMYFALGNAPYPHHIDSSQLQKRAVRDGLELTIYSTPEQALDDCLAKSAGNSGKLAEGLANGMVRRLHEAQVTSALETAWVNSLWKYTQK